MESYNIKNICQEFYFLVCIPLTLIVKSFKTEYQIIKIVPLGFRSAQIWEKCVCSLASSWSKNSSDEGGWIQHPSWEPQGSYWARTFESKTHSECLNIRVMTSATYTTRPCTYSCYNFFCGGEVKPCLNVFPRPCQSSHQGIIDWSFLQNISEKLLTRVWAPPLSDNWLHLESVTQHGRGLLL